MHFLREQRPVSRLQILLIQMKTCIAACGLWAVATLKSLLCLSAGALQEYRGSSIYQHTAFRYFLTDWQLAPTGLCSDLVTVDKDWHRLNLLTDSRRTSQETQTQIWNWLRQWPPCTPVVHYLQTVHCWCQQWQNSCILSSRLMTTPLLKFICSKLKDINQRTSRLNMPKDGRERYVLFFKITSEIKRNDDVCNHSGVARKDSSIIWSAIVNR